MIITLCLVRMRLDFVELTLSPCPCPAFAANVGVDEEKEERGLWGIKFELPWAKKKKE